MIGNVISLPLTGRDQGWGDDANMHGPFGPFGFGFKAFACAHKFIPPPTPCPSPQWGREIFGTEAAE